MVGPRRNGVEFVLERERSLHESDQTIWTIDEADPHSYEQYSGAARVTSHDKKYREMSTVIPYAAKFKLLQSCVKGVRNFNGQATEIEEEIKKILSSMRQPDVDELVSAITDVSVLTEGEVKNSDVLSDSSDGSPITKKNPESTTANVA